MSKSIESIRKTEERTYQNLLEENKNYLSCQRKFLMLLDQSLARECLIQILT